MAKEKLKHSKMQKFAEQVFLAEFKSLCGDCPHNMDSHHMNCLECCPVKLALKDLLGNY